MSKGSKSGQNNPLLQQATQMQAQMDAVREELKKREVTATGVGDKVSVTVTCEGRVRNIQVAEDFLTVEDLEMSLDAITATVNAALELADRTAEDELSRVSGGLKIPGITG